MTHFKLQRLQLEREKSFKDLLTGKANTAVKESMECTGWVLN